MKRYYMGGSGNGKWGGYTEPAKITEPIPQSKEPEGTIEGYDIGGIPEHSKPSKEKGEKSEVEKLIEEVFGISERQPRGEKSQREKDMAEIRERERNKPEAIAERERKAQFKAMSTDKKIEYLADKKMFSKSLEKEYKAWEKTRAQYYDPKKGWIPKLAKLERQWKKGGKAQWIKNNKRQAESIKDKIRRDQQWNENKKRFF